MSHTDPKPTGWTTNELLTSLQITDVNLNAVNSVDKGVGGDTVLGGLQMSGAGRIIATMVLGANANTVYTSSGGNSIVRVTSAVTANRNYTLSATGAQDGDVVTFYAEPSFLFEISVLDQAAVLMYSLGSKTSSSGHWASFIYSSAASGWRNFEHPNLPIELVLVFNSNTTFTALEGTHYIRAVGRGGGGAGGSGIEGEAFANRSNSGGGGGGGALESEVVFPVGSLDVIGINVGPGGSGQDIYRNGVFGVDSYITQQVGGAGPVNTVAVFKGAGGGGGAQKTSTVGAYPVGLGGSSVDTNIWNHPNPTGSTANSTDEFRWYNQIPQYGGLGFSFFSDLPIYNPTGNPSAHEAIGTFGAASGTVGSDGTGGYAGGGAGGGGGSSRLPGGIGGNGGGGNSAGNSGNGTNGANAAANSGAGGGGGGSSGYCSGTPGTAGTGGDGGSGQVVLYVLWTLPPL